MIVVDSYRDRRVAVLGLGRSGLATVRALVAGGAEVLAWDDDPARRAAAVEHGGRSVAPDADGWAGIAAVVVSPGVPLTHPAPHMAVTLADRLGAEVLGDVELFARTRPRARVVAITGTNGKSTTTALIGHILQQGGLSVQTGANFGRPVLDLDVLPATGVYVLELSSYQIDLTRSLRPQVSVLLNLSPDHLDRHGDMQGYVAAKRRLLEMTPQGGLLVVGSDDEWSAAIAADLRGQGRQLIEIAIGRHAREGVFAKDSALYRHAGCTKVCLADLRGVETLKGAHNWQNAAAAFAVAEALGLSVQQIGAGLHSFPGLPHRMEIVGRDGPVVFVNDSKATNAEATAHALAAYERIYWIAGGRAKAGGIEPLRPYFDRIAETFLIGEAAAAFAATLGTAVPHRQCGDLASALAAAADAARAAGGGVVLLSPACASFDQFESFEARGDAFRDQVVALLPSPRRRCAGGRG